MNTKQLYKLLKEKAPDLNWRYRSPFSADPWIACDKCILQAEGASIELRSAGQSRLGEASPAAGRALFRRYVVVDGEVPALERLLAAVRRRVDLLNEAEEETKRLLQLRGATCQQVTSVAQALGCTVKTSTKWPYQVLTICDMKWRARIAVGLRGIQIEFDSDMLDPSDLLAVLRTVAEYRQEYIEVS